MSVCVTTIQQTPPHIPQIAPQDDPILSDDIDTMVSSLTRQLTVLAIASGFAKTVSTPNTPCNKPSNRQKHAKFA